jgi:hypothetical protein
MALDLGEPIRRVNQWCTWSGTGAFVDSYEPEDVVALCAVGMPSDSASGGFVLGPIALQFDQRVVLRRLPELKAVNYVVNDAFDLVTTHAGLEASGSSLRWLTAAAATRG